MGQDRRRWWNSLAIEQRFKQRQILRVVGLALGYVAISTVALAYLLHNMPLVEVPIDSRGGTFASHPELARALVAWATMMTGLSAIFATAAGLYFTHKLAGPIYRFKQELKRIEEGKPLRRIALRRGDDFQDVAEALNRALDRIQRVESAYGDRLLDRAQTLDLVGQAHAAIREHLDALDAQSLCGEDARRVEAWRDELRGLLPKLGDSDVPEADGGRARGSDA